MASRSFTASSYVPSSELHQHFQHRHRRHPHRAHRRPSPSPSTSPSSSVPRTASSSSINSISSSTSASAVRKPRLSHGGSGADARSAMPHHHADSQSSSPLDLSEFIPSRPIAIELPSPAIAARKKSLPVYTPDEPLTARGDLPGGYFPFHEDDQDPSTPSYKPHPFQSPPSITMSSSSKLDAMSHAVHKPPPLDPLSIPKGKYHPSNYQITPTSLSPPPSLSAANLTLPSASSGKTKSSPTKQHQRKGSDVKRKLQQYQRDMIAQAKLASVAQPVSGGGLLGKPISPKLVPMKSPDELCTAMTPLELTENAGYLGAGGPGESREGLMVAQMQGMEERQRR